MTPEKRFRILLSTSGILGAILLILYFSAPFIIFPFPSSTATISQIIQNASQYQLYYFLAAWLQGTGTFLVVIFVLGLVYLAKAWDTFAGWITMLASTAILMLSLTEGIFFIDVAQSIGNIHPEATVTSFDLSFTFIHSFFIAPSLLLPLAFVLRNSKVLPRPFWAAALVLGIAFQTMGLVGLLTPTATIPSIILLVGMIIWMIAAAVALQARAMNQNNLSHNA